MNFYSPTSLRTPAQTLSHSFQSQSFTFDYFTQTTNTTATLGDPQAQLLERWKGFGSYLSSGRLSWKTVIAIDRKLDEVQNVLRRSMPEKEGEEGKKNELGLGITRNFEAEQPSEATGEVTPPASEVPESLRLSAVDDQTTNSDSKLLERVTQAVEQLRRRQQEFKHLHDVAIAKTEEGVQKSLVLKTERDQLQRDVVDDEAELTYLKLKLRIIEIQTLPYVPKNDQDGLAAGIERWKLDWADVDKRYRKRRWKRERAMGRDEHGRSVSGEIQGVNTM